MYAEFRGVPMRGNASRARNVRFSPFFLVHMRTGKIVRVSLQHFIHFVHSMFFGDVSIILNVDGF